MQPSRLAAAVAGRYRPSAAWVGRGWDSSASSGRTADPEVHAGGTEADLGVIAAFPEDTTNVAEPDPAAADEGDREALHRPDKSESSSSFEPFAHPKPPYRSSPRLESAGVHNPSEPSTQQQRRGSGTSATLDSVSCAGLDGSPWPSETGGGGVEEGEQQQRSKRQDQVEDDKEYFKHHKASPLSEIEIADTRKPITRATDGTADSQEYGGVPDVVGWRPEHLDTAEEALLRAARIWKESAMRGDPDAPQSRVLRALRGGEPP